MKYETESNAFLKSRKSRNVFFLASLIVGQSIIKSCYSSVELPALKPDCAGGKVLFLLINILILFSKIFQII